MTEHRLIDHEDELDLSEIDYEDIPAHRRWTYALEPDGDLDFNDATKRLDTVSGIDAITQSLKVSLASVRGEDPIDADYGLDIFEALPSEAHLEREIRRTLSYDDANHDRISSIDYVDIQTLPGGRTAEVDIKVTLDTGDIEHIFIEVNR